MVETSIYLILILTLSCQFFSNPCYSETTDTLQQGREFKDWDELISSNHVFSLRFFSFGTTISPYLGIFYHQQYDRANYDTLTYRSPYLCHFYEFRRNPVWVANRNNPILDMDGKLIIDVHGKLTILSRGGTVVDLFTPIPETLHASARLLDSGNFILQELYSNGSPKRVLWQSFDYPTDTLLPGMKLGIDLKTGHRWSLTSWASDRLPAQGSFTLTGDRNGTDQLVILRRGNIHWRSGPWKNGQFENTNLQSSGPGVTSPDAHLYYIFNETEQSFTYITRTYNSFPALRLYADGRLKGSALNIDAQCISIDDSGPGCAEYEFEDLNCRKDSLIYGGGLQSYIFKDEYEYDKSYNLTLYDCQRICWSNCSCVVFTYAAETRVGCKTYGQTIYNPAEAAKLQHREYYGIFGTPNYQEKKRRMWICFIIGVGCLAPVLSCYLVDKKFHVRGKVKKTQKLMLHKLRHFYNNIQIDKKINTELRYFTFQSILSATHNFSSTNKLGQGGFGEVYKGKLPDGQEVAVKRLSRSSAQGIQEFKNETELIVKLQHTNLVRLLGCCIEKQEKILVYEYMANNSLDFFLFDSRKNGLLDWNNRFVIIDGIAQGLLYLHKFSRLRIVHRDLKASNILLDDYLKPKISDFGMAKLFGINESEANTGRLVGTRGYMPPEYMREGVVSTKTDVFGFGVLLLEIISSKRNLGSHDVEHPLNLVGLAWELWNEGRGLELMDPVLEDSCTPKEVMTCIHVGLLCVQDHAMDRPTMSEVISMLTNENMNLPEPKQPAFYIERHGAEKARDDNLADGSVNGQSISIVVAR